MEKNIHACKQPATCLLLEEIVMVNSLCKVYQYYCYNAIMVICQIAVATPNVLPTHCCMDLRCIHSNTVYN